MTTPLWLVIVTGIMSAIAGAVGAFVALRKDKREARSAEAEAAARTIELLEQQNALLISQGEAREAEWKEREREWKDRERKLEERIDAIERVYRELVLTITRMGLCIDAGSCPHYNPGDRRAAHFPGADLRPGGTD